MAKDFHCLELVNSGQSKRDLASAASMSDRNFAILVLHIITLLCSSPFQTLPGATVECSCHRYTWFSGSCHATPMASTLKESFSIQDHLSRQGQTPFVSCGFRFQAPHGFQFVRTLPVAALLSKNPRLRIRKRDLNEFWPEISGKKKKKLQLRIWKIKKRHVCGSLRLAPPGEALRFASPVVWHP